MANKTGLIEKDGSLLFNGEGLGGASSAGSVSYDGDVAGAENVGDAIDNLQAQVNNVAATSCSLTAKQIIQKYIDMGDMHGSNTNVNVHSSYTTLRFVHITDTHASSSTSGIGGAEALFNGETKADFLVDTGDVVAIFGGSGRSGLYNKMMALDKPAYICLGNHDVAALTDTVTVEGESRTRQLNSFTNDERWQWFFNNGEPFVEGEPAEGGLDANNVEKDPGYVPTGKTYYSVNYDFSTSGVRVFKQQNGTFIDGEGNSVAASTVKDSRYKVIFLNLYDGEERYAGPGGGTTNLITTESNTVVAVKGAQNSHPSGEQIEWFVNELKDAASNNRCVVAFIHTAPGSVTTKVVQNWKDYNTSPHNNSIVFAQIMQAFLDNTSFYVTVGGVEHTGSFSSHSSFAGWFCGHTHWDCYGWLDAYPKQPVFCSTMTGGIGDSKENVGHLSDGRAWSQAGVTYVAVEAHSGRVSCVRYGTQTTKMGVKRDVMYINFK